MSFKLKGMKKVSGEAHFMFQIVQHSCNLGQVSNNNVFFQVACTRILCSSWVASPSSMTGLRVSFNFFPTFFPEVYFLFQSFHLLCLYVSRLPKMQLLEILAYLFFSLPHFNPKLMKSGRLINKTFILQNFFCYYPCFS